MKPYKGIVVFLVAPPSTRKTTLADQLFVSSKTWLIHNEWMVTFTYAYLEQQLLLGYDICITTTPNTFKEHIEPSAEYQRLLKNFTCKRLDLTNLNDLIVFP